MKRFDVRILFGLLLIAAGVLLMLQNVGVITSGIGIFWGTVMGVAGLTLIYNFFTQRNNWWLLIPGLTLAALGALVLLDELLPRVADVIGGPLVLGAIAAAFWLIFMNNRSHWWAIIPAGVMTSLMLVSGLEVFISDDVGGVFLIGLGITFALLGFIQTPQGRMTWAFIPAAVLVFIGFVATPVLNVAWPLALILGGGYLLYRFFAQRDE